MNRRGQFNSVGMNALEIFCISPLISYFTTLKNIRSKYSGFTIILICGFIGFLMNTEETGFDLYHYLGALKHSQGINSTFHSFFTGEEPDLYAPLSISIIGSFTKNGHILMLWFGLVFGFLYSKGLKRFQNSSTFLSFIFIFFFANIIGISGLAGVRFSTGFYVLFLGITRYLDKKDLLSILTIGLSVLFHFALLPGVGIFFVYLVLKRWPTVIYVLAIISFVFTFTNLDQYIANVAGNFGSGIQNKAELYSLSNTSYVESIEKNAEHASWYIKYKFDLAYYCITIFFVIVGIFKKRLKLDESTFQLFLFILLWLSFRNLIANVPDLGVRYTNILIALSVYFAYCVYVNNMDKGIFINSMSFIPLIGCSLCVAYVFRCLFFYISIIDFSVTPIWGIANQIIR